MSPERRRNLAASVRQRLLNLARERSEDFNYLLTRYANERLLFRLAGLGPPRPVRAQGCDPVRVVARRSASRNADLLGLEKTRRTRDGPLKHGAQKTTKSRVRTPTIAPTTAAITPAFCQEIH